MSERSPTTDTILSCADFSPHNQCNQLALCTPQPSILQQHFLQSFKDSLSLSLISCFYLEFVGFRKRLDSYRFVSQSVPVGPKQGGLGSQEGLRHTISGGRRLFLQLALERGHLVEYTQQECEAEGSRQKGGLNYHL